MHVPHPFYNEVARPTLFLTRQEDAYAYQLRLPARFRSPDDHTLHETDVILTFSFPVQECSFLPRRRARVYERKGNATPYAIISPFQSWIPAICIPRVQSFTRLQEEKGIIFIHETLEDRLNNAKMRRELENIITSAAREFFFPLPGDLPYARSEGMRYTQSGDYHVKLPTLPAAYEQLTQCPHIPNTTSAKQKKFKYHADCPLTFLPEYLLLGIILPLPYRTRDNGVIL